MHTIRRALVVAASAMLAACFTARTLPMHDPLYPGSTDTVTYSIEVSADDGVKNVKLYELVSSVDAAGTVTPGTEVLLQDWSPAGSPTSTTLTYARPGAYPANSLVRYRFLVTNGKGKTRSHDVTFATRPYPVAGQPAPVYVQGDRDHVFDVVFIPDTDVSSLPTFYGHCRGMIRDSVFAEPSVRPWSRQFNFYVNPNTGHATDYDRIAIDGSHQVPANWANLSFAEVKLIMHQGDLRDYATGGLFSTEQQNRGTMMHEGGHAMFSLADSYDGGAHWQEATLPNNWSSLAGAQTAAPSRHKTAADATQIGTSAWYKICSSTCQMNTSGLNRVDYDAPCTDRVVYSIFDNALH